MTISTHVYSAVIIGSPDVALKLTGGTITLDAGRAPHVEGTLTIASPSLAILNDLDPRTAPRIRVSVSATFPTVTQSRTFDLGLRDRNVDHEAAEVTLDVASDEALLADFAPLLDDKTPLSLAASIRDVIDYVIDAAIPGYALEATPANDADMTPIYDARNLLKNPSATGALAPWTADGNCTLFHAVIGRTGSNSAGYNAVAAGVLAVSPTPLSDYISVTPGKEYTLSGYGRISASSPARTMVAVIRWITDDLYTPWGDTTGTAVSLSSANWNARATVTATAPQGAVKAHVFFRVTGSTSNSDIGYIDDAMFHEGALLPYFDGDTTDTADYLYTWDDTAHDSTSSRTALVDTPAPDAFVWRSGQNAMDFLAPLVQAAGFRLVCDEARDWTLRDETYSAAGSLSIRHAVNLIAGTDTISRDSGLWFDAAVTTYSWTDLQGFAQTRQDAYGLGGYTRLRTFEKNAAYPGPGFSEYAVRRAEGRGREVSATAVADWTARAEQDITIVLENAPTQVGATSAVTFDLNTDRLTVTTRTLEIGTHSIDGLTGTINALTGTINGL